jgi:hypothetical protein
MKNNLLLYLLIIGFTTCFAQHKTLDSLAGFDNVHFQEHLDQIAGKAAKDEYSKKIQRDFIKRKYNLVTEKVYTSSAVSTSTCGNLDFEDGNTANWAVTGDFQVMTGSGLDPFGGFPVVCPGGNFSLRLNDNNTDCITPNKKVNFKAAAINTINITSTNFNVKVNFAGVMLSFPHPQMAAANIRIEFFDQFNNALAGGTYTTCYASPPNAVIASSPATAYTTSILGAQICSSTGSYPTIYYPWQTQTFNLSPFIGQIVKIKLSADWCLYDYDWGYAYFDVCCDGACPSIITNIKTPENPTLKLYPNPFKNEIIIDTKNQPEVSEFVLYNCLGQEVLRKRIVIGKNSIDTGILNEGLYFYSLLNQNKQVRTGKLVKE